MEKKLNKLWIVTSVVFIIGGIVLNIPTLQNYLIIFGGKILGRPLNHISLWVGIMVKSASISIGAGLLAIWLYIRTTEKYQQIYNSQKEKNDFGICVSLVVFFFLLFILPFIIFGENSVITIHDNLDDSVPRFHYIHQHKLFWIFNKQLPVLDNLSTLFFNREGFSIYNAIYCLLPTYVGYVVNHALCILIGFFSMLMMQRLIFKNDNKIIITLTSLAFALLPVICVYKMGVATIPFAVVIFYKLLITKEKRWFAISFIYPFFSELSAIGLFVCGFWLLAIIFFTIKEKKLNLRILYGLALIVVGFCMTNSRLIYMRFVVHEPLNRDFLTVEPTSFIKSFITFFFNGYYHAATIQNRLLDWVVLITSGIIFVKSVKNKEKNKGFYKIILIICLSLGVFCALVAALSESKIMDKIIAAILPPLEGVSLTRIYTIARVSWYVAFTTSLLYIASSKEYEGVAYVLGIIQILIIFIENPHYADSEPTWRKNIIGSDDITWREFYSEKQFKQIKETISYNGEPVCAVGYHPGVLLYNDLNAIDGYISVFPYEKQLRWHNLLKPEFDRNPEDMQYFDSWGGRRYVYNKDLRYTPTREKYHKPVDLYIDMNILKNDYHCKYVLSRAELSNSVELGLKHKGTFDLQESIYVIWVYEVE